MDITFSKDEYRLLLDMVYIAEWVLNAHKTEEDERTLPYAALEQKLFSRAAEAGLGHLIEYAPEFDRYLPTRAYEEGDLPHRFLDEYDDESFWDELANRLAERDVINLLGSAARLARLAPEKRVQLVSERENAYIEAFIIDGLKNLHLARGEAPPRGRIRPS